MNTIPLVALIAMLALLYFGLRSGKVKTTGSDSGPIDSSDHGAGGHHGGHDSGGFDSDGSSGHH